MNSYKNKPCAYCGLQEGTCHGGHVIPKKMYPTSSKVRRVVVPECHLCKKNWDDDAHFRAVIAMCGEPNEQANEMWYGPISRSFEHRSGSRWIRDLRELMVPVETTDGPRHKIYPLRDERVTRILKRIVRGLCQWEEIGTKITNEQVFVTVEWFEVPPAFRDQFKRKSLGDDFCWYSYSDQRGQDGGEFHSVWEIEFYGRTRFFCIVSESLEAAPAQVA